MNLSDFDAAFKTLTTHHPFPWQRRLFDRLRSGDLPSAVDIPTGLGKTAVMAIWLLARAAGAPLPRRLVYVVDRRAVVDQATDFAEQLRERLQLLKPSETCATAWDSAAANFRSPPSAASTSTTGNGWTTPRPRRSSSGPST